MEDDGKNRPEDEEKFDPSDDSENTSEPTPESGKSDDEEFTLEGEMFPQDPTESEPAQEDEGKDEDVQNSNGSEDEETSKPSEQEDESPEHVGEEEAASKEESSETSGEKSADEDASVDQETSAGEDEASGKVGASAGDSADGHHSEEDGYEHWHEDYDDYHGDGYHEDEYHEESAVAKQVTQSVTDLQPHEDEDIAALDDAIEEGHMTFLEHLEDLRGTLFRCAGTFLAAFILVAVFFVKINEFLRVPLEKAMANHGIEEVVVTTTPFGIFSYLLQMAFLGALAISSPFLLYFITSFVAPGLTPKEKRALLPASLMALLLLCLGCTFSYFVLIPSALNVSIYLNELLGVSLMWSVDRYMNLLLWMVLGVGLLFEFPLVLAILVFVGIISVEQLKGFRRYAIVIMFVLSAFITPTQDPITMMLMAGPLVLLYEAAIIVSNFIEKRRKKAYEAEFGTWDED